MSETQEFKPATKGGKEYALQKLKERIEKNKNEDWHQVNIGLPAGADMFFGCDRCNGEIRVPELYTDRPHLCPECQALKDCGWLE